MDYQPEGLPEISRGLSTATPPESVRKFKSTLKRSQKSVDDKNDSRTASGHPLLARAAHLLLRRQRAKIPVQSDEPQERHYPAELSLDRRSAECCHARTHKRFKYG